MHIPHILHSSVDEHLGCFHVLVTINSAAKNPGVYVSFWIMSFPGYMPSNGIAGSYESPLDCKEIQPVHSEGDQPWDFFGRNDAKAETPVLCSPHAKSCLIGKDWCWEELESGGEGDDREWDDWMASLTRWTWVWVNSGSWWWTGRPGVLRFMGLQRVRHDWATELNWIA